MKALTIVLVVLVIQLAGFSAYQYTEVRDSRAQIAHIQSLMADLADIEETLQLDILIRAQSNLLMAMSNAAAYYYLCERDFAESEIKLREFREYTDERDKAQARIDQYVAMKVALLRGGS